MHVFLQRVVGDWQHHHQADHNAKASDENSGARHDFRDHFNGGHSGVVGMLVIKTGMDQIMVVGSPCAHFDDE
jgi:hypothetical protein